MTTKEYKKTSENIDNIVRAINTLVGLGVYPLEFEIDINTLCDLAYYNPAGGDLFKADENGIVNLWENASKYNFSIMGIPIRPKRQYGIQIREKEKVDASKV